MSNEERSIIEICEKEFEKFISDLFTQMGYHLNHHKKSYDGGIYMYAKIIKPSGIAEVIIQSMRVENANTPVNENNVKKLHELFYMNKKISKAYLVTNGIFNVEAIEFAKNNSIELIDGTQLNEFIKKQYSK